MVMKRNRKIIILSVVSVISLAQGVFVYGGWKMFGDEIRTMLKKPLGFISFTNVIVSLRLAAAPLWTAQRLWEPVRYIPKSSLGK